MTSQLMLPGYCQIPLYKVSGDNFHPDERVWTVCGYTTVDSDNYRRLNQYKWIRHWNPNTQSYYAVRNDKLPNGKRVVVYMAREILGLPRGAGHGGYEADHVNHDTLKNTRDNLRRATHSQNIANGKTFNNSCRFKGINLSGSGFQTYITYNYQCIRFPTVRIDVEAALVYNYAADLLFGEFANLNQIPEDEMPSYERQCELYEIVLKKLSAKGLLVEV